jgi:actin-like protein 6A
LSIRERLHIKPEENAVLFTEPTHNTKEVREKMVQMAFEHLRYVCGPHVVAAASSAASNAASSTVSCTAAAAQTAVQPAVQSAVQTAVQTAVQVCGPISNHVLISGWCLPIISSKAVTI